MLIALIIMVATAAYVLSSFGGVLSVLLSLSPIPNLVLASRSKDFSQVSFVFLVMGHIGSTLWLLYAISADIPEMIPNNFINYCITLVLNALYLKFHAQLLISTITYIPSIILLAFSIYLLNAPSLVGYSASTFNCIQLLSLLLKIWQCLKTKDSKFLDLNISVAVFLCSFTWLLYGILTSNLVVIVPNFLGISISFVIFLVYLWTKNLYPECMCPANLEKTIEETPLTSEKAN